jgi:uncharacterized protein (DUF488 family)
LTADAAPPARDLTGQVWTIGYEGRTPDQLVADLRAAGVEQVLDVRELPLSRKRGFSKSSLAALLQSHGIAYAGERRLGAPREIRHRLRGGGAWEPFAAAYLAHLDGQDEALAEVEVQARRRPTALLCYERDALACHRSLLAGRLARRGLLPVHL